MCCYITECVIRENIRAWLFLSPAQTSGDRKLLPEPGSWFTLTQTSTCPPMDHSALQLCTEPCWSPESPGSPGTSLPQRKYSLHRPLHWSVFCAVDATDWDRFNYCYIEIKSKCPGYERGHHEPINDNKHRCDKNYLEWQKWSLRKIYWAFMWIVIFISTHVPSTNMKAGFWPTLQPAIIGDFLTLIRGAVETHVWVKGLNLKEAILNSQPLFTRCR